MYGRVASLLAWALELVNPPLRENMNIHQKYCRIFVITGTLLVGCVMSALITVTIVAIIQQVLRVTGDSETLVRAVGILLVSIAGNVICVITLVEIRRIDRRNIPRIK